MADTNWVTQIGSELERIFRYLLPGITVLGFARLSHPSWFRWVCLESSQHLVLLAAIALSVGSSWYVAHRYSVHQLVDYLFYCVKHGLKGYPGWLARHVADSSRGKEKDASLRHNIGLRSAQIIFMFITGEAALLFSFVVPEQGSFFCEHRSWVEILAASIVVAALWQQWLVNKIDLHAVDTSSD